MPFRFPVVRGLVGIVAVAAALGCLVAFVTELRVALGDWEERPLPEETILWRFATPQAAELARLAASARGRLPEGAVVAVDAPALDDPANFFLYLWAAYRLPRHDVVRWRHPEERRLAGYLLAWGEPPPGAAGAVPLLRRPSGGLYRLPRRGEAQGSGPRESSGPGPP